MTASSSSIGPQKDDVHPEEQQAAAMGAGLCPWANQSRSHMDLQIKQIKDPAHLDGRGSHGNV